MTRGKRHGHGVERGGLDPTCAGVMGAFFIFTYYFMAVGDHHVSEQLLSRWFCTIEKMSASSENRTISARRWDCVCMFGWTSVNLILDTFYDDDHDDYQKSLKRFSVQAPLNPHLLLSKHQPWTPRNWQSSRPRRLLTESVRRKKSSVILEPDPTLGEGERGERLRNWETSRMQY